MTKNQQKNLILALYEAGFELAAVLSATHLPDEIRAGLPASGELATENQSLLLVANTGQGFWNRFQAAGFAGQQDPVDSFTSAEVTRVLGGSLPGTARLILYPHVGMSPEIHMPLQRLGETAGWHQPSPLGIGIHPVHGLWFAYRALFLLDIEPYEEVYSELAPSPRTSVCLDCESQACIEACPANALASSAVPDMKRCTDHRLTNDSECQNQCLARNACPVGSDSSYLTDQINYHYSVSLASIKQRMRGRRSV